MDIGKQDYSQDTIGDSDSTSHVQDHSSISIISDHTWIRVDQTDIGEIIFAVNVIQDILASKLAKQKETSEDLHEALTALKAFLRRHPEEVEAYNESRLEPA